MKKPNKKALPHIVLTAAAWLIFAGCLIRFLAAYGSLPREIGIHFAGDGSFDVIDNKLFGFYPFLVSLITLVICGAFSLLVKKASIGKKVTQIGAELMRLAVMLYTDISQLAMVLFYSGVWSDCVIRQHPLDTRIAVALLGTLMFGLFPALIIFLIAVRIICREKK